MTRSFGYLGKVSGANRATTQDRRSRTMAPATWIALLATLPIAGCISQPAQPARISNSAVKIDSNPTTTPKYTELRRTIDENVKEWKKFQLAGREASAYFVEAYPDHLRDWQKAAELGWPDGEILVGKCREFGVGLSKDLAQAAELYQRAANSGSTLGMDCLGASYLSGQGLPKDPAEAMKWFQKAADAGDTTAMMALGYIHANGLGVTTDRIYGAHWYRKAADADDTMGMVALGTMYESGSGVDRDYAQALNWYRKAADAGTGSGMIGLGRLYLSGRGVVNDDKVAADWFRQAAEVGNPEGMTALGASYESGKGVEKDYSQAVSWYRKAAEAGSTSGMVALGVCYVKGQGVEKDPVLALSWILKGAKAGNTTGMLVLGSMYDSGQGVEKSGAQSLDWFRKAASAGDPRGMVALGRIYANGRGVEKNYTEALNWFRSAAALGDPQGQASLAIMYLNGQGVPKNLEQAFNWFRRAAEAGNLDSMVNLGSMYANGQGVEKDNAQAMGLFRKAADAGNPEGMIALATMYAGGIGVAKDNAQALTWINQAAEKGNEARLKALTTKANILGAMHLTDAELTRLKSLGLIRQGLIEDSIRACQDAIATEPADSDVADRYLGDLYFQLSRWADAEKVYEGILQQNKTPATHERVVRRLIEAELRDPIPTKPEDRTKLKDATSRLDELISANPGDTQILVLRAFANMQLQGTIASLQMQSPDTQLQRQRLLIQDALVLLNRALAIEPANSEALYYRAAARMKLSDQTEDVMRDLLIVTKSSTDGKCRRLLVELNERTRHFEDSARWFEELIRIYPDIPGPQVEYKDILWNLAQERLGLPPDDASELGESLRRLDPESRLLEQIKIASERDPNQPIWPLTRGQLLQLQGKDDQALRIFQSLHQARPNEVRILDSLLDELNHMKQFDQAAKIAAPLMDAVGTSVEARPDTIILNLHYIASLKGLGKDQDAADELDRALTVSIGAAVRLNNPGAFFSIIEKAPGILSPEIVAARLRSRLTTNPNDALGRVGLMSVLLQMKKPDEALTVAQTGRKPDDPSKFMFLGEVALVKWKAGQYAAAVSDYQSLLILTPRDVAALNNCAFLLVDRLNQPDKALEMADRALQTMLIGNYSAKDADTWASVYDTLGWAKLHTGDTEGAIAALRRSMLWNPTADTSLHLAMACEKAGKKVEALDACAEGIKLATLRGDEALAELTKLREKLGGEQIK